MSNYFEKAYHFLNRNKIDQREEAFEKNRVNLVYWRKRVNLGDVICPVIVDWVLKQRGIDVNQEIASTQRLLSIGSVLDLGKFDATVWGSGLQSFRSVIDMYKRSPYRKLDIRSVRGPLTRQALTDCGYPCPEVYGDPGILLPLIYPTQPEKKKDKREAYGVIHHHSSMPDCAGERTISILTADHRRFVDEITGCEKIISSSLHGIIFAESYGIPAVFLQQKTNKEFIKYYDYYYSTGRYSVKVAHSLEEALDMEPMVLPELDDMRNNILNAFPYDLWE